MFACTTSLSVMLETTAALGAVSDQFSWAPATCVSCRRVTNTMSYARRAKCAHCSRGIEDDGLAVVMEGDAFHRSCWQMLLSIGVFASHAY